MPDRGYWQRRAFAGWRKAFPDATDEMDRKLRCTFASALYSRKVTSWSQLSTIEMAELAVCLTPERVYKAASILDDIAQAVELRRQRGLSR